MGIEEFFDFMPDTVTTQAMTGRTVTGAPDYSGGATTTYGHCRIQLKNHRVIDGRPGKEGQETMARGRVYLGSTVAPGVEDKLTLPSGYVPRNPPIIAVNIEPDETGSFYVSLDIG